MNKQNLQKLEHHLIEKLKKMTAKSKKIIIGLSGGPDSVFLTSFTKKHFPEKTIIAAHLNHDLRGEDSQKDQVFVESFCKKNNIKVYIKKLAIRKISQKNKENLEQTARNYRLLFFSEIAKKEKCQKILLAHHANDNLETILFNFIRGGSLNALMGIQEIEKMSEKNLKIHRPLLEITKKEILEWLQANKIRFRIDKSNKDPKFNRNFLRHKIIPLLESINPNLTKTITANLKTIQQVDNFVSLKATNWLKKNYQNQTFPAPKFLQQNIVIQKEILRKIHQNFIGNTNNITAKNYEEIVTLIKNNIGNKEKNFGKLIFRIKKQVIYLEKKMF